MRRYLALAALSSTALLSGCAGAGAEAVQDTKTPAPTPTVQASAERDSAVETCYQAGLDSIADDYAHVVDEDTTLESIWARQHSINDPGVEAIPGGYSVLFEGSSLEGGFPSHLCELVDGEATITVVS
ncbi:hypothetical protein [Gulosibacter sediminis]|uniref:hypothetical protein n=1 Tax=Gulosibacter sediminis TaxID=1729695 RepID=UPI0024A9DE24|nr:hypothetical protein [Gulosibacter sediminis]